MSVQIGSPSLGSPAAGVEAAEERVRIRKLNETAPAVVRDNTLAGFATGELRFRGTVSSQPGAGGR